MQAAILGPIINTKFAFKITLSMLFVVMLFAIYFDIAALFYIGNFLFCCVCIYNIYLVIPKSGENRESWVLILLGLTTFIASDLIWAFYKIFLVRTSAEYEFLRVMYLVPTVCLFGGNFIFLINRFTSDSTSDKFIIINDMISVFLMIAIFFIAIFDGVDISRVYSSVTYFSGFFNIIFSFFILFCVMSMAYSNQISKLNTSMFLFLIASAIYACTRIYFSYSFFLEVIYDSKYLMILFDMSLLVFSLGAAEIINNKNIRVKSTIFNTLIKFMWPVFLVPIVVKNDKNIGLLAILMFVFVCHSIVSHYTKNSISIKNLKDDEAKKQEALEFELSRQTNEMILTNLKLKEMIDKDYLTGIGSRAFIIQKLKEKCKFLRQGNYIVTYYINIKRFKNINATYGQEVGDKILHMVGKRLLTACADKTDIVGRFSADEFIVITNMMNPEHSACIEFANSLIRLINAEMAIGVYRFSIESVVGIEITGTDSNNDAKDIIKNADKAMYFAKQSPNSNAYVYDESMDERQRYRARLEILMQSAVLMRDFDVHYQPVFDIKSGKIIFAEAFIRWNNREFGFLEAAKFIDIIKSNEYSSKIYSFVLNKIIRDFKDLDQNGIQLPVSINITYRQTTSLEFINIARNLIQSNDINPKMISFEFNEGIWANDGATLDEMFKSLKELGVRICIDDFGIGQSSLIYIKKYEISAVKVASELTANIVNNPQSAQILSSVVAVGRSLNIKTVVKSVEDLSIYEKAKELGCDEAQGYALSHPKPIDRLVNFAKQKGVISLLE
ncbi:putative bifunctional diguanylate cyclase/phosphodiesterase [Campylobacter suis]|uniref:GGDEF-domain containing protein n=1 Tax=Campylobacter suis TaxID=2790657 RepID=A0ABM8Q7T8_9BACT|nr:bifunctional diguanylate cyclase/phosphodiesterase [Campylobacter suis]CAD7288856.1 hypothetical protein LMG8286_01557 [Campylobacter suis]